MERSMNCAKHSTLGGARLPRRDLVGRAASLAGPAALAAVGLPAGRVMADTRLGKETTMKPAPAMSDDAFSSPRLERMREVMAGYVHGTSCPGW